MNNTFESGASFIWQNARLLERSIFERNFLNASPSRIINILRTYQNDDGGFGHALEPDLRCPESQPLFVEFGLRTLYDCGQRDSDTAFQACEFLSKHADLEKGIPLVFPSFKMYPHAAHMDGPYAELPSMERLTSLVGLLKWQGISHPWLDRAVDTCLTYIEKSGFTDAHTIINAFCLIEALTGERNVDRLINKLSADLLKVSFFNLDPHARTYGLTPLTFAPAPTSFFRRLFTDDQIKAHLDALVAQQDPDGGWPIQWEPPAGTARMEWRGYKTVLALTTLHAYGKI